MRINLKSASWSVVQVAAIFLMAGSPARAEMASIVAPDGSQISVWEVRVRGTLVDEETPSGSALQFSVLDASGMRSGTVAPTADSARDTQPTLAVDPATGTVALLWSRFDGVSLKIAYARLDSGAWNDFHFLTFGPGNDTQPRVASSSTGSYLFWIARGGNYLYAPIELSAGRLLAAGRSLDLGSASGRWFQAGVGGRSTTSGDNSRGGKDRLAWTPYDLGTNSADAPLPPGHNKNKGSVWGVRGSQDCRHLILVVPDQSMAILHVVQFADGLTREVGRVQLPAQVPDHFAELMAAAYLSAHCQ